jgi:hypothetical protein
VEAQRSEAQATALAEVLAWRATAMSEINAEVERQFAAIAGPASASNSSAYVYHDDDDDDDDDDEHKSKRREHEDDD